MKNKALSIFLLLSLGGCADNVITVVPDTDAACGTTEDASMEPVTQWRCVGTIRNSQGDVTGYVDNTVPEYTTVDGLQTVQAVDLELEISGCKLAFPVDDHLVRASGRFDAEAPTWTVLDSEDADCGDFLGSFTNRSPRVWRPTPLVDSRLFLVEDFRFSGSEADIICAPIGG